MLADDLMDKNKSHKNVKVESGGNGTETSESIPLPRKHSKKKHSKKSDGEFNGGHFSFRYLLCNSPFYPQRFRCRNRRLTGEYFIFSSRSSLCPLLAWTMQQIVMDESICNWTFEHCAVDFMTLVIFKNVMVKDLIINRLLEVLCWCIKNTACRIE